jgi:thioredoxin reductase (NADPH)
VKLLLSTGATAKYLGLPSEQHYLKWVVVFLLVQFAIFFYRNQEVVIVGAGDSACEEAHYPSKLCKKNDVSTR